MLDDPAGDATGGDVAAPIFKKIGDAIMCYKLTNRNSASESDLKLVLRDWPASEIKNTVNRVEIGKVPDIKGLTLKSAIHLVILAGGIPKLDSTGSDGSVATRVQDQTPLAGTAMEPQTIIRIKLGMP
jgi:hypothetical protein